MVSNLVSNALESHAQVFPTLTEAQINRVRPFASLRQVNRGDVLFSADDSDVPFFILLSGSMERCELRGGGGVVCRWRLRSGVGRTFSERALARKERSNAS